jgi:hypothetical protein
MFGLRIFNNIYQRAAFVIGAIENPVAAVVIHTAYNRRLAAARQSEYPGAYGDPGSGSCGGSGSCSRGSNHNRGSSSRAAANTGNTARGDGPADDSLCVFD